MEHIPLVAVVASLSLLSLSGCTGLGADEETRTVPCPSDLEAVPHDEMIHIELKQMAFNPAQATAEAGQVIMWVNAENVGHTVTPNSGEDPWPKSPEGSGSSPDQYMQDGDTWFWCFEKPGTYAYHCIPHATRSGDGYQGMVGTVTVS